MQQAPRIPHYLRVALAITSAISSAGASGCGGTSTPPSNTGNTPPATSTSASASSSTVSVHDKDDDGPTSKVDDYTGGSGPCRCSWDTKTTSAPRVCKKGETAYNGTFCMPRKRPKYPIMVGPLPPPDMPSSASRSSA